jgi:hypothetical protein
VSWQSEDRLRTSGRPLSSAVSFIFCSDRGGKRGAVAYQFDTAIPRAGGEGILCDQVPGRSINLTAMFMPVQDRGIATSNVKQLD